MYLLLTKIITVQGSFNYIKKLIENLIENKIFSKYNRDGILQNFVLPHSRHITLLTLHYLPESDKKSLDIQVSIDPKKLIYFIEKF